MRKFFKISAILMIIAIFGYIITALPVLAQDGEGTGGGQGVPLGLATSDPADGQQGVSLQPVIKLTFNKNVINLTVREANKSCFSLVTKGGSPVSIEVIMADDQINPEEKRNVSLKPLQTLKPGTAYMVKISPQLQAKNGMTLGHEVTVNFVTAGTAAVEEPTVTPSTPAATEEEAKPQTGETSQVNKETNLQTPAAEKGQEKTVIVKENQVTKKSAPLVQTKATNKVIYGLLVGLVLLAAAGYIYYKKRNAR